LVIKQENESYVVNKFMMVTIKLIGNVIVCDDKSSVSVIDPKTMQKIGTVTLPNENCYLYSAYYHELTKRIYLAFDNKKILSIDSSSYKNIGTITLPGSTLYFTQFHADPQNYVLLACDNGIIQVFYPARNNIVATFDVEKAVRDDIKENDPNRD
jgi:DNA-binding beta-propeller fold protein YncE